MDYKSSSTNNMNVIHIEKKIELFFFEFLVVQMEPVEVYNFCIEDEIYPIPRSKLDRPIFEESLLKVLINTDVGIKTENIKLDVTKVKFDPIYNWIITNDKLTVNDLETLDYLNINMLDDYELASIYENDMRKNMYQEGYEEHEMNTNPYYALQQIDKQTWKNFEISINEVNENMLFHTAKLEAQQWKNVNESLEKLSFLFEIKNIFIAGEEFSQHCSGLCFLILTFL